MKKPVVLTLFILILVGLFVWLLVNRGNLPLSGEKHQTARTIIPSADNGTTGTTKSTTDNTTFDESRAQPLIVLEKDETFLQALSVDINKDGTSDQICAIKKNSEPNIYLVPGIQNPQNGDYTRLQAIRTGVTQTRTLLFYSIDIIGDRTNALVCSGMTAENLQLLAVYIPVTGSDGKLAFSAVADLRSDGSINIQETNRSDAYNLGLTSGDSYPISTYSSDPDAPETLDQIERVYRWDKTLKRYELASQSKIEGKRIESKLMNKLQDGDIGSFESFLGGLWYMTSTSDSKSRYIYFDTAEREIIFHNGATEEIYTREAGSSPPLRHVPYDAEQVYRKHTKAHRHRAYGHRRDPGQGAGRGEAENRRRLRLGRHIPENDGEFDGRSCRLGFLDRRSAETARLEPERLGFLQTGRFSEQMETPTRSSNRIRPSRDSSPCLR